MKALFLDLRYEVTPKKPRSFLYLNKETETGA